jgi:hypothetical protein
MPLRTPLGRRIVYYIYSVGWLLQGHKLKYTPEIYSETLHLALMILFLQLIEKLICLLVARPWSIYTSTFMSWILLPTYLQYIAKNKNHILVLLYCRMTPFYIDVLLFINVSYVSRTYKAVLVLLVTSTSMCLNLEYSLVVVVIYLSMW